MNIILEGYGSSPSIVTKGFSSAGVTAPTATIITNGYGSSPSIITQGYDHGNDVIATKLTLIVVTAGGRG